MSTSATNQIERDVLLRAPVARVWRALADSSEFGAWFGMEFRGPFVAGERVSGRITDPPEFSELEFDFWVEAVEPEKVLAFRWHPYAVDPEVDYSSEPTTLVTFTLEAEAGGTRLTVVESGFDDIPLARRAQAFEMNTGGWEAQMERIETYLAENS